MSKQYAACWYRALSLNERIALSGEPISSDTQLGQKREQEWRKQTALEEEDFFAGYLESLGISQQQFIRILGEDDASLQQRMAQPPAWLQQLQQLYAQDCRLPPLTTVFKEQCEEYPLLAVVAPVLADIYQQLQAEIDQLLIDIAESPFDSDWVREQFYQQFVLWVLWVIIRPMILELNISRMQQEFPGETSAQRFEAFIEHYRQSSNAIGLLQQYPVMARKIIEQVAIFKRACITFLQHLLADYTQLNKKFFAGQAGKVTGLEINLSDPHRNGCRVFRVTFAERLQIIYKPKSLAVDQCYQQLLKFINDNNAPLDFKIIKVWDRGEYGWAECVAEKSCQDRAQFARFYQRQGINMALLYALNANDFHHENLIAQGEHPILIDLETLCQPAITDAAVSSRHIDLLNSTVLALGLLPYENGSTGNLKQEVGGLGGASGQSLTMRKITGVNTDEMQLELKQVESISAENLPTLEGEIADAWLMTEPVVKGFIQMYQWLLQYRDQLLAAEGPLARFADVEVRTVLRNTVKYSALSSACWHPDIVQNALFKDRLFAKLWRQGYKNSLYRRVCPYEISDLERGDVPIFSTYCNSRDLKVNNTEWLSDVFSKSGLQTVSDRLNSMDSADMQRQIWLIRGSFDIRRPLEQLSKKRRETALPTMQNSNVDRKEYLREALKIGERIEQLMITDFGQANWFDIVLADTENGVNRLRPMGPGLYSGLSGMALFFEHLAQQTGSERMAEVSQHALAGIHKYIEAPEQLRDFGIGAYNGWPSIVYMYVHMARLRKDKKLLNYAERMVDVLSDDLLNPDDFDLISGVSGTLLVLSQLSRQADNDIAKQRVKQLADWLVASAIKQPTGLGWANSVTQEQPLTGLGHGVSGVILALTEAAIFLQQPAYLEVVKQALAYEDSWFCEQRKNWMDLRVDRMLENQHDAFFAWCHGAPGIGLARVACAQRLEHSKMADPVLLESLRHSIRVAAETSLASGFGDNHCLCHGDLGNLEMVVSAADYLNDQSLQREAEHVAMQVLKSVQNNGYRCGSAFDRELLGLMLGLAGIGYGLLRFYNPQQVPSVLLLET